MRRQATGFFVPDLLRIDWNTVDMRRRVGAGARLPLVRACGLHKSPSLRIVDTTAGLGRDAIVLATFGAQVHMLERVPSVHRALEQAMQESPAALQAALKLSHVDARAYLQAVSVGDYDVALIDPMFVGEAHKAKAKRDIQALRSLAGGDGDAVELAETAWRAPIPRLVIKRSPKAPALLPQKPAFSLRGNRTRFDVYLRPDLPPSRR